jgi:cellulase/cellobiase CelA1
MKKQLFLLVLVLTCMTLPVYAQWGWLGDMLDEAINEAYGDSSGSSSSSGSGSSSFRSGSYYTVAGGTEVRLDISLESESFQVYYNGDYAGRGIAVKAGNVISIQFTEGYLTGRDTYTIISGDSFVSNVDGYRYTRR